MFLAKHLSRLGEEERKKIGDAIVGFQKAMRRKA